LRRGCELGLRDRDRRSRPPILGLGPAPIRCTPSVAGMGIGASDDRLPGHALRHDSGPENSDRHRPGCAEAGEPVGGGRWCARTTVVLRPRRSTPKVMTRDRCQWALAAGSAPRPLDPDLQRFLRHRPLSGHLAAMAGHPEGRPLRLRCHGAGTVCDYDSVTPVASAAVSLAIRVLDLRSRPTSGAIPLRGIPTTFMIRPMVSGMIYRDAEIALLHCARRDLEVSLTLPSGRAAGRVETGRVRPSRSHVALRGGQYPFQTGSADRAQAGSLQNVLPETSRSPRSA
jgi:hypothetical protein